jgi:hypothetical protein
MLELRSRVLRDRIVLFYYFAGCLLAMFGVLIALTWLGGGLRHLTETEWTWRIFGVIATSIFVSGLIVTMDIWCGDKPAPDQNAANSRAPADASESESLSSPS